MGSYSTPERIPIYKKSYWSAAFSEVKKLRSLVFAALICALTIVISSFFIPIPGTQNLRVYFKFIVSSVGCTVFGPVMGCLVGAVSDTLGFIIHPQGPYFPGYLISEVLSGLIYGLFLYRSRITVLRLSLCRLCVNIFINFGLGCLWSHMLYGKGYLYYAATSIVKNVLILPLEVIILMAVFSVLLPALRRMKLVPKSENGEMSLPLY